MSTLEIIGLVIAVLLVLTIIGGGGLVVAHPERGGDPQFLCLGTAHGAGAGRP